MKRKQLILIMVAGLVCLVVLAVAITRFHHGRLAPLKLRFGVAKTPMSLLAFVAQEKGFFAKHGLDVSIKDYQAGALAAAGLVAGEVEVATAAEFLLVNKNMAGADLRAIASIARVEDCEIIARKDRGIESVADLKGKRMGTVRGTALEFFLDSFLTFYGIPVSSVTIADFTPVEAVEALAAGSVDAIIAFSPYTFYARQRLESNAISWPFQERQNYFFLLLTGKEFLQSSGITLERLLSSLLEAQKFVADNRAEAQAIVKRRLNLDDQYASLIWSQQIYEVRLDQSLFHLMEEEARWLMKRKGSEGKGMPNYLEYIDWHLLGKVKPQAVGIIHG